MKKGFTLVELIAVVAILGIIATIAGISYTTINNNHKKQSCENLEKLLETSAIEYVQDNNLLHLKRSGEERCGCPTNPADYCMCVSYKYDLLEKGYIEKDIGALDDKGVSPTDLEDIEIMVRYDDNYSAAVAGGLCN